MKYLYHIATAILLAVQVTSCNTSEIFPDSSNNPEIGVFGDHMKVRLNIVAPDPIHVGTKAVDPDGKGVQTMTLFCFDEYGLFISTATASVAPNPTNTESGGIFDAFIPNTTRIMHLVGNQNMTPFKEDAFRQKSEDEVMSILEGSAGMMIYWARVEVPENVEDLYTDGASTGRSKSEAILDWITIETNPADELHNSTSGKNKPIIMLRNQARMTVSSEGATDDKKWNGSTFKVTGFTVCNTQAFGTVAPYHSSKGFPTYVSSTYTPSFTLDGWKSESEITLPADKSKLSDITDVSTSEEVFVFETQNSGADPVDVIIKGRNIINGVEQIELYYKASIVDENGEQLLVRRNHHYEINVTGNLSYGSTSFGAALDAPATNNIWLSISDEVKMVRNAEFQLEVDQTSVVINEADIKAGNSDLELNFNVKALGSEAISSKDLSVSWQDSDQVVSSTHNNNLVVGQAVTFDANGNGTINLSLNDLSVNSDKAEGTLIVKYEHLQRKIKVVVVKTQHFTPAWVSTEVYGEVTGEKESRQNATVMFNIPESCPEELFPLDVLISVNGLDVRSESGMVLPVIREGEDGYGADNGIGYKYKYTVTETGVQRVYFENILSVGEGDTETITIEAENFETLTKTMTFSENNKYLVAEDMLEYSFTDSGAEDEKIKYILVPQKRYAPVIFNLNTMQTADNGTVSAAGLTTSDEFLLYSSNLDHYEDDESRLSAEYKAQFDCYFKAYGKALWGTGGRVFGFFPRQDIDDGDFAIYMETNTARSAEVVRIASNQPGQTSVINDRLTYAGQTFRSVTFEMANYRPFRFAAQVQGEGDIDAAGIRDIEFTYEPDKQVEVSFDVTSFASANAEASGSVDPFGTGFEIYIDAPMLMLYTGDNPAIENEMVAMFEKVDGEGITTSKKKLEDLGDGRFVYRVDPDRTKEASFWGQASASVEDNQASSQAGERKTLVFRTNSIVNSGEITISSNQDQVVFDSETFKVSNLPILGTLSYVPVDEDGNEGSKLPVPAGQFISFSRIYNGSRIGSMTVAENGAFELRLRKEYEFYWVNDPIMVMASIGGTYYSAEIPDLKTLFESENREIVLVRTAD